MNHIQIHVNDVIALTVTIILHSCVSWFQASLTVLESDQDYSEKVGDFINETIPNILNTYAVSIPKIIPNRNVGKLIYNRKSPDSFIIFQPKP